MSISGADGKPRKTDFLMSWKEIAFYIGRGTRTLQRWQREYAFPVRKTHPGAKSTVLAVQGEIDDWVKSRQLDSACGESNQIRRLRRRLEELQREIQDLRSQLAGRTTSVGEE